MTIRERKPQALTVLAQHKGSQQHIALLDLLNALLQEAHEELVAGEDMRTIFQAQGSANTTQDILKAITRESA